MLFRSRQSHLIGHDAIAGEVAGGFEAWSAAGRPVARIPLIDAAETGERLVVDVRQSAEYSDGHPKGAVSLELGQLGYAGDGPGRIQKGRPLVTICGHGERAMSAASLLESLGFDDTAVAEGGVGAMRRAGVEME